MGLYNNNLSFNLLRVIAQSKGPRTRYQVKKEQEFAKEVKLAQRNKFSYDVELKCQELSSLMIEEVDVSIRRKCFVEWSKVFEKYLEAQDIYEKYCTDEEILQDRTRAQTKDYCSKFKEKLQNWISQDEVQNESEIRPEDSVSQRRSRSSRSIHSVSSSVKDQITKAQLEVQSEILKERHVVQQKKLELKFQEEQLNLREKIAEV
ncbi:hypothetical protein LOTGIDRAFT_157234 [Lottia gigantea]|uniref:Uncharacterized protein n=1 Tax=Lottia gigantea TaxID=225164 RepID=V4ADJ6_LOTGI|nr:hypothetical protein LOTGIDRAFT_157234 [Lottia gigantea]ESP02084.1 hypothetical protein LOTGIDRAFT_157234 [Lottia gigantea]